MRLSPVIGVLAVLTSSSVRADQAFPAGTYIIPMDASYQNAGMLKAYGLVYRLLQKNVPVTWSIRTGKSPWVYDGASTCLGKTTSSTCASTNGCTWYGTGLTPLCVPTAVGAPTADNVDFTASATDYLYPGDSTRAASNHGYRGGPFIVPVTADSTQVIDAYLHNNGTPNPIVTVHVATAGFTAPVSRTLVNAPNIGVNADGNEPIAFTYLNDAKIPDSRGQTWPTAKKTCPTTYPASGTCYCPTNGTTCYPDVLTPAEVAGPTTTNHRDGKLFGASGLPVFCQYMSMHWNINERVDETMAEMSQFLAYPTHLFAECQAVSTIEDAATAHFVSTDNGSGEPLLIACNDPNATPNNGLCKWKQPAWPKLEFRNGSLPFAQVDGPFATVGGSETAYGPVPGPPTNAVPSTSYYDTGIVMIRSTDTANPGDLWMTGYAKGVCNILDDASPSCSGSGKVSYLGGHSYPGTAGTLTAAKGQSQGARLFLNSLFEAGCTTTAGEPVLHLSKSGPVDTTTATNTYRLTWSNTGPGVAVHAVVRDTLAAGVTFVSATGGGTYDPATRTVTWNIGDVGPAGSGSVSVVVTFDALGNYENTGALAYTVGNSQRTVSSNTLSPIVFHSVPDAGAGDAGLCAGVPPCSLPAPADPCSTWVCDPSTGNACTSSTLPDSSPCDDHDDCTVGTTCTAGMCGGGYAVQCPASTPCQAYSCQRTGGCTALPQREGLSCNPDACTTGATCLSGTCVGGMSLACPGITDSCLRADCDPATGCYLAAANEGASCDDGNACSSGTTCNSGICSGGTVVTCPPPPPCTVAQCTAGACDTPVPVPAGQDPNGDCPSQGACTATCDGAGACTRVCVGPGATCADDSTCSTGHCADTVCCDSACTGPCMACNVTGHGGTCTPVPDGTTASPDCFPGMVCDGSGGCRTGSGSSSGATSGSGASSGPVASSQGGGSDSSAASMGGGSTGGVSSSATTSLSVNGGTSSSTGASGNASGGVSGTGQDGGAGDDGAAPGGCGCTAEERAPTPSAGLFMAALWMARAWRRRSATGNSRR